MPCYRMKTFNALTTAIISDSSWHLSALTFGPASPGGPGSPGNPIGPYGDLKHLLTENSVRHVYTSHESKTLLCVFCTYC